MKQKKIFIGLASLVAAVGFTACSSDDADFLQRSSTGKVISLTSAMGMRGTSDPQASQLSTSVHVGVFAVTNETTPALISNGNNNEHTVSGTNLVTTSAMTWPTTEGTKVNFYAYAPYQSTWIYNTANTFSVATDQSDQSDNDGYIASDLVYGIPATNPVEETDAAIPLTFTHKMAQIAVTIKKQEGAPDLTGATVTIANTKTETTFNPSTGEVPAEATGSTTPDIKAAELTAEPDATTGTTVYAAIAPQTISAGTALVKIVTAGNKTLIAKIGTDAITFESGKAYTFTVNVGTITAPETIVTLSLSSTAISEWNSQNLGASDNLYAKFGSLPGGANCSYASPLYKWTNSSNNLIPIFENLTGKLDDYKSLVFTLNNLSQNSTYRFYFDGPNKEVIYKYGGRYVVDLTSLNDITLSEVTQIRFGGKSTTGQCSIDETDIYLSTREVGDCPEAYIYANPVMSSGANNGSYSGEVYKWEVNTSNLMNCFEFSNGELANYSKLIFSIRNFSDGAGSVRLGYYVGSTWTEYNSYSEAGLYTINLADLNVDLRTITKISFGGKTGSGSVIIKPSEIILK
ncbi:MAG: fimbrillin family protein [Prevotella sp.]|nr:fimbrillin family protein [Prevotella sp.]